jgi:hypothetical protein
MQSGIKIHPWAQTDALSLSDRQIPTCHEDDVSHELSPEIKVIRHSFIVFCCASIEIATFIQ